MKVGNHVCVINNNYLTTIQKCIEYKLQAVQFFIGSPKSYYSNILKNTEPIKELVEKHEIFLISHSPYILNFAHPVETTKRSRQRCITDLINITNMGGVGTVVHMGFNIPALKQTLEKACQNMIDNLTLIAEEAPGIIILENMAGKGTSMCCEMKEWAMFWGMVPDSLKTRIKWCVDTAHLWGTGEYYISKCKESYRFCKDFRDKIGLEYLLCLHFNGSCAEYGSRTDRHDDINFEYSGNIETRGLRQMARLLKVPLILEVPCIIHIQIQRAIIESWGISKKI